MYKLVKKDSQLLCINKVDGDKYLLIPLNPDNADYQAYLKWVEAGNTPESADE